VYRASLDDVGNSYGFCAFRILVRFDTRCADESPRKEIYLGNSGDEVGERAGVTGARSAERAINARNNSIALKGGARGQNGFYHRVRSRARERGKGGNGVRAVKSPRCHREIDSSNKEFPGERLFDNSSVRFIVSETFRFHRAPRRVRRPGRMRLVNNA